MSDDDSVIRASSIRRVMTPLFSSCQRCGMMYSFTPDASAPNGGDPIDPHKHPDDCDRIIVKKVMES